MIASYFCAGVGFVVSATFIVAILVQTPAFAGRGSWVWVLVGLTAIPEDDRNRRLRDVLEEVNATVSVISKRTHLIVAGRALDLSDSVRID